jgi:ATP/ADP translocase
MHQITFIVEVVMTLIVTIVIGYISKNILQKKLIEQEKQNKEADGNDGHLIGIS